MGDCAGIGFKNCERRGGQNSLLIEGFKYGLSSCLFCGKNLREAERSTSANFHTEIITRRRTRYHVKNFRNVANNCIHDWKMEKNHDSKLFLWLAKKKPLFVGFFKIIKRGHTHSKNKNLKLSNFLFKNSKV